MSALQRGTRETAAIALTAVAVVVFLALVWSATRQKSETIDEGLFIGGGVAQVRFGQPNFDLSHPPLLRWVSGVSAVVLGNAKVPSALPPPFTVAGPMALGPFKLDPEFRWARSFFYDPENDHDAVLFWGRFPFALLAALIGMLVFLEVRRVYGGIPAAAAAAALLFTPEFLAHAQWAHSDIAAALTTLTVALCLARALESQSLRSDVLLGVALGIAVLAKITALALVILCCGIIAILAKSADGTPWRRTLRRLATILGVVWLVIVIGYLPRPRLFPHEFSSADIARLVHSPPRSATVALTRGILRVAPLPDGFLKGVVYTQLLASRGQIGFFHGARNVRGFWYYYPAALFLKYPTPLLLLAIIGLVGVIRSARMTIERKVAWIAPPIAILLLAMTNHVNIGVRAVLPLAPFLALWCGAALATSYRKSIRITSVALLALTVVSGIAAYPNFLAYFNPLLGGTPAASRWLVDSNLDWGQDLPALKKALDERGVQEVRLAYFGAGRPKHWGINALPAIGREPGWYAISRSYLSGWWPPDDPYAWLRAREPEELVGGSIALFRVDAVTP
jgi:hypothetical protein